MKTKVVLCGLAALGMGAPFLVSQTHNDSKSPVIEVESREVPVDVIVTGKKNVPAGKLTAKDFSIREDGKLQKINSVELAAADPAETFRPLLRYQRDDRCRSAGQQRGGYKLR